MRTHAHGLSQIRPTAEEILLAAPDLIVRQWGGGHDAQRYYQRFDIPVVQIAFGIDFATARANLRTVGQALEQEEAAERMIAAMDKRLANVVAEHLPQDQRLRALYMTPAGVTGGTGTFTQTLLDAAGVQNMAEGPGWRAVDLEAVALNPPDLIAGAFFDLKSNQVAHWSLGRHSFVKQLMARTPRVMIPGAQAGCSAWFMVGAVESVARTARTLAMPRLANAAP